MGPSPAFTLTTNRRCIRALFLGSALFGSVSLVDAQDAEPVQSLEYSTSGDFLKDKGTTNLSGIACLEPGEAGARRCLVINDELQSAQFVTIEGEEVVAGEAKPLTNDAAPQTTVGEAPKPTCGGGTDDFDELDGEAVAVAEDTFYVVSSHGCSRNKDEFRESLFLVSRFKATLSENDNNVEFSFRLADALEKAPKVGAYFQKSLKKQDGINVEGAAVVGGELLAGLRAPSLNGNAYIVSVPVDHLFAGGKDRLATVPKVREIELGAETGIRDMAPLSNGRLLVLAGPTRNQQDVPYSLVVVGSDDAVLARYSLPSVEGEEEDGERQQAKGEGLTVLAENAGEISALVLYEDLLNGRPTLYRIPAD